jgi:hypothetical protein
MKWKQKYARHDSVATYAAVTPHFLPHVLYFKFLDNRESRQLSQYTDSLRAGRPGGSNPGGGEILRTRPERPWGPPSLLYNGYQVFPVRGVVLTIHPHLGPRLKKE